MEKLSHETIAAEPSGAPGEGIAVIGLAGRFPGAANVGTFWENLCAGVESITTLDEAELEDAYDAATRASGAYVKARGILEDVDRFDAGFFGIHPREAELIDPQHRVLLETAWEALEDAGCDPAASDSCIGVYAGCSIGTYLLTQVLSDPARVATFASDYQVGSFPTLLGSGSDFLATRLAYKLDLRGPAMTLQSACSTALLAIAQAVQALRLRQADVMLACAASITFPQQRGYLYQDGGMVSHDGHCRTFDAGATGTVFGAGAGVVVLKRLADARRDGDRIYAVVRGVGVNNDGSAKVGYSAPSVSGQAKAIALAHRDAGFDARSIDYVECHGTATPLGDPIEVAALARAFAESGATHCALGSVKPNVGHLDVAAGMAGFIKTTLAIHRATLPPTLHFTQPNPRIDFAATPFYVHANLGPWPQAGPTRRAGVSAFGVGGTNVHAVLESEPTAPREDVATGSELLVLSGRSDAALARNAARLATYLRASPDVEIADAAWSLQVGRRAFAHRRAAVVSSSAQAIAACESIANEGASRTTARSDARVAFLFPGQGSQYVGMGRELYLSERVFRDTVDRCAEIAWPSLETDLRAFIYPPTSGEEATSALTATDIAQPAIFTIAYALCELLRSLGIRPATTAGHSVGEFVSAVVAGVFTLEDALLVVCERGRLMRALAPGAMLAVRMSEADLAALLPAGVAIAAINSPMQSVVSGPFEDVESFEAELNARGVLSRRVATSHAFHSAMMADVRAPLAALIATLPLAEPSHPYVSTVTGTWIEPHEATSPAYWADHALRTVRFSEALATLAESGVDSFVEVGPGTALATNARQMSVRDPRRSIVSTLVAGERAGGERGGLLEALGTLWEAGNAPDWTALRGAHEARRISLPTYAFDDTRYWVQRREPVVVASPPEPHEGTQNMLEDELAGLLEELSGESVARADRSTSFLELGFDSLFLGRFVQQLAVRFGVTMTFRQLLGDVPTLSALATYVASCQPATLATRTPLRDSVPSVPSVAPSGAVAAPAPADSSVTTTRIEAIVREQLAAMQQIVRDQLQMLQDVGRTEPLATDPVPARASSADATDAKISRFEAFRVAPPPATEVTHAQREHIEHLVARVSAKTAKSKAYTQRYRSVLADPRVAAGFRAEWKEMVYPIVCDRAAGSRLWDIDGNEYVDILNGFGQTAFGHAPDFVTEAVRAQLDRGFAIGPQNDVAGEVAERFCAMTGNERMTFCNTGSEAVMAAMRVARTVTGRDRIVVFSGAYHGQFDEVLVKGARTSERSIPIAPGIPTGSVANITVLPYATPETLAWVRKHASELAAVIVEPVQSRHPSLQPKDFLTELRAITSAAGAALVFDEVVTGFRVHPGGLQAVFDIRADLATYGKVIGGGMPIGILAGSARFMDALDGGSWSYGDDSSPEVPPTFFAGTFVRHPLVMQAVLAVLRHLETHGLALQEALTARTASLVQRLNADLEARGLASRIETFGSLFFFNFTPEERLAGLLYYHMRDRGIYIQEGFPCFLTTTHREAEIEAIVLAFAQSLDDLQAAGIFTPGDIAASVLAAPAGALEVPLTEEQTEVWLAAQGGDDASCAFNESVTIRLSGPLDAAAFETAWRRLIARHDALRATFSPTGETMRVEPGDAVAYAPIDLRERATAGIEDELARYVSRDAATPFDLEAGPPVRAALLRLEDTEYAFVFTAHHLVCDGWSINTILEEFASLYTGEIAGEKPTLGAAMRFTAYAADRARRARERQQRVEPYWLARFERPPAPLDLPLDRPRAEQKTYAGASLSIELDATIAAAIKAAGAKNGCTLFVTLLTAFHLVLGRLGNANDVVVCVPAAGQALLAGRTLVGHCVNFLPIRSNWSADSQIAGVLASTRTSVLDAYEYGDYTLGSLVRAKKFARDPNRLPLADVQFNLERLASDVTFGNLESRIVPNAKAFVNFDLFLNIIESAAGLRLDCDFNTRLFDRGTIGRFMKNYRAVLAAMVRDSSMRVAQIDLDGGVLAASESERALSLVAGEVRPYPNSTIHERFEANVVARPDAPALVYGETILSYGELDRRANRLARYVRSIAGNGDGRVGISVSRSCDLVVAVIASLKAGFAYVPLDPTHPTLRRQSILAEADIAVLIVDAAASADAAPAGIPVIDLVRDAAAIDRSESSALGLAIDPNAPAYVIFTSGTTGVPKGVEVAHRSLVNLVTTMAAEPGFTPEDVLVAVTTIGFDMAAFELYLPLAVGGTVVMAASEDLVDGYRLRSLLERSKATMLQSTPATWRLLLEAGFVSPPGFRMLSGGEPLPRTLADRLLEGSGELWNVYGPTETTVYATRARVRFGEPIAIGSPIGNTQAYVLDDLGHAVPRGTTGELYVGGDALAIGYFNATELTERKFVSNPFHGGRMFRTGDAARMLPDGTIETYGRLDDQIKLRGYRIELGEVETAIARCATLSAAAVALHDIEGRPQLVGYVVPRASIVIDLIALGERLRAELPEYMVPTAWVTLDALPLSANGKLDRRALPPPQREIAPIVALETPLERQLGSIWADVLGRSAIGRDDDIFNLGADSIQIFQIIARAHRAGIEIAARDVMQKRTIGNIVSGLYLAEPVAGRRLSKAPASRRDGLHSIAAEARTL